MKPIEILIKPDFVKLDKIVWISGTDPYISEQ